MKDVRGSDSLKLVSRILIGLSFSINCFLQTHPNNSIEITGPRRSENDLVYLGSLRYLPRAQQYDKI